MLCAEGRRGWREVEPAPATTAGSVLRPGGEDGILIPRVLESPPDPELDLGKKIKGLRFISRDTIFQDRHAQFTKDTL